jgi:ABC-type multidrug transport system ATPase subunit/pSer/pThr/pTyr-binding forkhead associated (FHA) protein
MSRDTKGTPVVATELEPRAQRRRTVSPQRRWVIGADPGCDVVVDRPTVSRRHCRLTEIPNGYLLEDLGSSNGTFVNGGRVTGPEKVSLEDQVTLGLAVRMPWPQSVATDAIWIGRDADNHIVLDYPVVSAFHARIRDPSGQAWIEDLGSTNGTALQSPDHRIQYAPLSPTDVVYFGSLRVPAARLLQGNLCLGAEPYTALRLPEQSFVFGRGQGCDHVLNDPQVSRRHARLVRVGSAVSVEDLQSTNGTYVNGRRIRGRVTLKPGDVVGIGSHTFTVANDGNLEQRDCRGNVAVEAHELAVDVPQRRLLEGVSLTVYPSEFVGLMGPSGAGKTTLMNVMNGYTPPSDGAVLFNGRDLYANYGQFRNVVGYVPQDDIMHGDLTVGQALYYTARLRLPTDFTDKEIRTRIKQVVGKLGLEGTESVLIGSPQKKGISGGQRKRVNLAMELLTDPSVLFLDEPTSGLSSEDALMVMKVLRGLADQGKTIILTIHQPSLEAYSLLDNLILVGKDQGSPDPGRLVYYGPAYPQAVEFFNPDGPPNVPAGTDPSPDEILRGFTKKNTSQWVERYAEWPLKREYVDRRAGKLPPLSARVPHEPEHPAIGFSQWWTLVRRCFAIKLKDRTNTAILLAQAPIIAVLIALVFGKQAAEEITPQSWPSIAGAVSTIVFLLALAALWFGCSNSARDIVGEWPIYHRERMVNLKIPSYVASKFAVLGALCVVQCAVLLLIVHWIAALQGLWLAMFFIVLLTALVGLAIGLTVSSLARTSEVAIALLPLILLPMVILAGVMQPVHKMNPGVRALAHCMPTRWAFEALLLVETKERPPCPPPLIRVPSRLSPVPEKPENAKGLAAGSGQSLRPVLTGAAGASDAASSNIEDDSTDKRDMAEEFFPIETDRMGVRASVIALLAMLVVLVAGIHLILWSRDVH